MNDTKPEIKPVMPADIEQNADEQSFSWQADLAQQQDISSPDIIAERQMDGNAILAELLGSRLR